MAKHNNTGGLWLNQYKITGDKRPDYVGEINIAGVIHKISGWINLNKGGGRPVINLVINGDYKTPPVVKTPIPPREVPVSTLRDAFEEAEDWESDIPF